MGQMEGHQAGLKEKLAQVSLDAEAGDGAVRVTANGNREITNIAINRDKLDWDDPESVEDMVMVAVNRALEKAAAKEAEESQQMMNDILPPGLAGMFGQ